MGAGLVGILRKDIHILRLPVQERGILTVQGWGILTVQGQGILTGEVAGHTIQEEDIQPVKVGLVGHKVLPPADDRDPLPLLDTLSWFRRDSDTLLQICTKT